MANFLHHKFSFICICSLVKCRTVLLSIRVKRTSYRHQLFCHILVWFVSANYIYMTEVLSCFQPPCQFTCLVSLGAIAKGKKKRKKMYLPGYYVQGLVFSTKIVGQFYGHSLWSHSIFVSKNVLLRTCRRVAIETAEGFWNVCKFMHCLLSGFPLFCCLLISVKYDCFLCPQTWRRNSRIQRVQYSARLCLFISPKKVLSDAYVAVIAEPSVQGHWLGTIISSSLLFQSLCLCLWRSTFFF